MKPETFNHIHNSLNASQRAEWNDLRYKLFFAADDIRSQVLLDDRLRKKAESLMEQIGSIPVFGRRGIKL